MRAGLCADMASQKQGEGRTVLEPQAGVAQAGSGPGMMPKGCKWHPPWGSIRVNASCGSRAGLGICTRVCVGRIEP